MYDKIIRPQQLTKEMMIAFVEYLQAHGKGEGPQSIYQRFKKVLNYAVECKYSLKSGPVSHSKMGHPREHAKLIK